MKDNIQLPSLLGWVSLLGWFSMGVALVWTTKKRTLAITLNRILNCQWRICKVLISLRMTELIVMSMWQKSWQLIRPSRKSLVYLRFLSISSYYACCNPLLSITVIYRWTLYTCTLDFSGLQLLFFQPIQSKYPITNNANNNDDINSLY